MLMLATLPAPPPPILPTDQVTTTDGVLRIRRGGVILFTVDLRPLSVPFSGFVFGNQIQPNQIYWERTMAGLSVQISSVSKSASGVITIRYNDGDLPDDTYDDFEQLKASCANVDSDDEPLRRFLRRMMVAASPDGSNLTAQIGAQFVVNFSAGPNGIPVSYIPPAE